MSTYQSSSSVIERSIEGSRKSQGLGGGFEMDQRLLGLPESFTTNKREASYKMSSNEGQPARKSYAEETVNKQYVTTTRTSISNIQGTSANAYKSSRVQERDDGLKQAGYYSTQEMIMNLVRLENKDSRMYLFVDHNTIEQDDKELSCEQKDSIFGGLSDRVGWRLNTTNIAQWMLSR